MPELSSAEHFGSLPELRIPRSYNAAFDLIERNLEAGRPDQLAFIDDRQSITYGELAKRVNRFASGLRSIGVEREDRILLCMLDTIDWPTVFLGAIKAGVVPVCVNTLLAQADYDYMLRDSRAKALFVSRALFPAFDGLHNAIPSLSRVVISEAPLADGGDVGAILDNGDENCDAGRYLRRRRLLLALFFRLDRRAQGHDALPFQPDPDGRVVCPPDPRHRRARPDLLRGQALLRLWPGQRADLPDGGRAPLPC